MSEWEKLAPSGITNDDHLLSEPESGEPLPVQQTPPIGGHRSCYHRCRPESASNHTASPPSPAARAESFTRCTPSPWGYIPVKDGVPQKWRVSLQTAKVTAIVNEILSRNTRRCNTGLVSSRGPIVWVSYSTSAPEKERDLFSSCLLHFCSGRNSPLFLQQKAGETGERDSSTDPFPLAVDSNNCSRVN